jgi:prepilin peptidase CpaA
MRRPFFDTNAPHGQGSTAVEPVATASRPVRSLQHSKTTRRCAPPSWKLWAGSLLSPVVLAPLWLNFLNRFQVHNEFTSLRFLALLLLVLTAAILDIRYWTIPNWVTYPAALWGLLLGCLESLQIIGDPQLAALDTFGLLNSMKGVGACLVLALPVYYLTSKGAGDVKLAAALGALLGPRLGIWSLIYASLAAGGVVICYLIWTLGPLTILRTVVQSFGWQTGLSRRRRPIATLSDERVRATLQRAIPLAPYFAVGTLLAVLDAAGTPLAFLHL